MAFISQSKVYFATYCALCCAVVKHGIITTAIIFSCHSNSFLINTPLLKLVAFNVTPFNLALFDAALFNVELF